MAPAFYTGYGSRPLSGLAGQYGVIAGWTIEMLYFSRMAGHSRWQERRQEEWSYSEKGSTTAVRPASTARWSSDGSSCSTLASTLNHASADWLQGTNMYTLILVRRGDVGKSLFLTGFPVQYLGHFGIYVEDKWGRVR
jgi:hypothetical protein